MRFTLSGQPNAYAEIVRQVMFVLLGFHIVNWTTEQQALVLSLTSALLAVVVWRNVVPTQTVEDAGHSVTQIKADAKAANADAKAANQAQP